MKDKLINRQYFGKIIQRGSMPSFLEFQLNSYEEFLQLAVDPQARENKGLESILRDSFPVESSNDKLKLEYLWYDFFDKKKPFNEELECKRRGKTYAKFLKVMLRLTNKKTGEVQESLVHFGEIPIMTDKATFMINGAERVVVSQLHRSPGVSFHKEVNPQTGKELFIGKIIPYKGTWLEFETDKNDCFNVKIDRKKKVLATQFLKAAGFFANNSEIMEAFFEKQVLHLRKIKDANKNKEDLRDVLNSVILGKFIRQDIADEETGEILLEAEKFVDDEVIDKILYLDIDEIEYYNTKAEDLILVNSFLADETKSLDDSTVELFKKLRPGDLVTQESAKNFVKQLFFNLQRYSLATVGRYKLNKRLKIEVADDNLSITKEDIISVMNYVRKLFAGEGMIDDIDNLSNRRVRGVGELLEIQLKTALAKITKMIREKMTIQDINAISLQSLLNTRPLNAAMLDFFGSGQLSQFMDQSNPLAELTHKRRISALGPGGLSRDRAGFEVRDVHDSHYGRICPIETPEGPNIGLIGSLATYAKVNKYGFIETPYIKITQGKADMTTMHYLAADEEIGQFIAQADTSIKEDGTILVDKVLCRIDDEIVYVEKDTVDYMDVSPKQLVSVSAAIIPFLEHDDVSRALMGSNMQRQSVPLLKTQAPFIGTGIERKVAVDSGAVMIAKNAGTVIAVDARNIVIQTESGNRDYYKLLNFERSNQAMCLIQKPIVDLHEKVEKGDIIADGPGTAGGDLALGKNVIVAFMPWEGYNYEDAILINERLIKDDVFTSIHIEEYQIEARSTKVGDEEITREVPNVGEDAIKNLDDTGVIRIGAEVTAGDILVGKITPKGETEPPAEEKLLRAIFGEKARDVRDNSLRLPHGAKGTVVDILELSKENNDDLPTGVNKIVRVYIAEKRKITVGDKIAGRHGNKGVISRVLPSEDMPFMEDGTPVDIVLNPLGVPSRMNIGQVLELHMGLAAGKLGRYIATPVFDGAKVPDIEDMLEEAGYDKSAKVTLIDGRTGQPFDNPISVGYMYILKLHHLVEDKLHARSIGPYSLVSQQPLGGKAQFGGQRLGEMEVWALEAYGVASILQEMLTVKSDDVTGRAKTYEAIVKGETIPEPDLPESFKVMLKEFNSLGLNVDLFDQEDNIIDVNDLVDDD